MDKKISSQVKRLLTINEGQMIPAVKYVRKKMQLGLQEALQIVKEIKTGNKENEGLIKWF